MVTLAYRYTVKQRAQQRLLALAGVREVGLGGKLKAGRPGEW